MNIIKYMGIHFATFVMLGVFVQGVGAADNTSTGDANQFNRIMKKNSQADQSLQADGIHDPANKSLGLLQQPATAFESLPKARGGNGVNWVKALDEKKIIPRHDIRDASVVPMAMDLNIVREVKGSMPNVVFPHKQHTEILDCSNCHPDIFIPQKGANQLSMAASLLGQQCGVCHGKVAFPMSRCSSCHSGKKQVAAAKKP